MAEGPTTVLLVDDHTIVREGVQKILESQQDLVVVGQAGDAKEAVALAGETKPDVVLLDVEIPGDDVETTVTRLHKVSPRSQVIILSMYDAAPLLKSLLAIGIRGYLLKSVSMDELVSAVRSARRDDGRVLLSVSRESLAQTEQEPSGVLSHREREILELTAQAMSNSQIASRLSLTEATVKRHMRKIFAKLGAVSRIDAVNKAMSASLIKGVDRMSSSR
ncbi:LuxR family two component transcriptional regulator [Nonomuraea polychroma]|uniref:LuxR family two component transcriptional regulator n=1 Tax=Nonomuraea polychroma TaxID=46176 RepID=A0A438M2C6_9ACTN|nr:response regulator transcription factor [Nonomuraea polychroma]RVX39791.1 LuxR family two component transcriptional regulator [Nonomuraea polychroma]